MRLWAISDVHLAYPINRQAFAELAARPDDWLIMAGDMCEKRDDLAWACAQATSKFARVLWVPGNHELWTMSDDPDLRGVAKYEAMRDVCRAQGVLTPDDDFVRFGDIWLAPLFNLYDYSFRPADVSLEGAVAWAAESGVICSDEHRLDPTPYPTRAAWCDARVRYSEDRLAKLGGEPVVIINHFPLREELAYLPFIPRFKLWCGTTLTEQWHRRFNARVVVSGHLHIRSSRVIDQVRFEEVSLGYPKQWTPERGLDSYLRLII